MSTIADAACLSGKVWKRALPVFTGPPEPGAPSLKRMLLPQGELAQVHDSDEGIHFLACIELREGTTRGNHFHKVKREFIYLLSGAFVLLLEDVASKVRETMAVSPGELVFISTEVAHTLRLRSPARLLSFRQAPIRPRGHLPLPAGMT